MKTWQLAALSAIGGAAVVVIVVLLVARWSDDAVLGYPVCGEVTGGTTQVVQAYFDDVATDAQIDDVMDLARDDTHVTGVTRVTAAQAFDQAGEVSDANRRPRLDSSENPYSDRLQIDVDLVTDSLLGKLRARPGVDGVQLSSDRVPQFAVRSSTCSR